MWVCRKLLAKFRIGASNSQGRGRAAEYNGREGVLSSPGKSRPSCNPPLLVPEQSPVRASQAVHWGVDPWHPRACRQRKRHAERAVSSVYPRQTGCGGRARNTDAHNLQPSMQSNLFASVQMAGKPPAPALPFLRDTFSDLRRCMTLLYRPCRRMLR